MTGQERQTRWRLILGAESQPDFAQMGAAPLSQEELLIDGALAAIYGRPEESFQAAGQGGGHGPSAPHIAKWLGDLRSLFDPEIVAVVQNDAIARKGLKQLLLEPELLEGLEPSGFLLPVGAPPQAAREIAITALRAKAINFFIV